MMEISNLIQRLMLLEKAGYEKVYLSVWDFSEADFVEKEIYISSYPQKQTVLLSEENF